MKRYRDGQCIELTPEEVSAMQEEAIRISELEKSQPPTPEERLAAMESAMIALMGVV